MQKFFADSDLPARLPQVRGRLTANALLAAQSWFRVGGPAEVLYHPADADDLAHFLANCPPDIPVTVLGAASNTLIRDGGVPGVVIRLTPAFAAIRRDGDRMHAGAASIDLNVARAAQSAGLAGMEFLCGIPGTIGGGLRMNAGSYGREFKDIVLSAEAIDRDGTCHALTAAQIGFSYRHSNTPDGRIYVAVILRGEPGDPGQIQQRMNDIQQSRGDSQPIRERTGGSTFANPPGHKSWQLIEAAGCRGLRIGDARMSDKHCNFMINTGHATADDLERLGEEVRRRVFDHSGIKLHWEIRRIGVAGNG